MQEYKPSKHQPLSNPKGTLAISSSLIPKVPKESSKGSEVPATREVLGTGNPGSEEMGVDKGEEAWISLVPEGHVMTSDDQIIVDSQKIKSSVQ